MTPFDKAIEKMRSPHQMHIICVDVTNKCDLHCSNCTRLLKNQKTFWDMTPENFRKALQSLKGYPGVIAMIGGNPCMHPQFEELCEIFAEIIPDKQQRGLWTNNIFKYQKIVAKTFGTFNLNPHNDPRGIASLWKLKLRKWNTRWYKGHSTHAPLLTAIKDLYPDPELMWEKISGCDINQGWSAAIVQNNGQLRAYFCEVAASFDLAQGGDLGQPLVEGWWQKSIADFREQVEHFCPSCGVPARLQGSLDSDAVDTYSTSNEAIVLNSTKKKRKVIKIAAIPSSTPSGAAVTSYPSGTFERF